MGDANAIPTGVWIRAELVAALREALNHRFVDMQAAAQALVDAVETEDAPDELTALRERIRAIHRQHETGGYCVGCWEGGGEDGAVSWPCPTIRALGDA